MASSLKRELVFLHGDVRWPILVEYLEKHIACASDEQWFAVSGELGANNALTAIIDGHRIHAEIVEDRGSYHVFCNGDRYVYPVARSARF